MKEEFPDCYSRYTTNGFDAPIFEPTRRIAQKCTGATGQTLLAERAVERKQFFNGVCETYAITIRAPVNASVPY